VIQRHDRWIAPTTLEATDILLGDAGHLGEALLGEALRQSQPCKIPANQPAHVHARKLNEYTLSGLSPIMCIRDRGKPPSSDACQASFLRLRRSPNGDAAQNVMDEIETFLDECRADPWFQSHPELVDRLESVLTKLYLDGEGPEWEAVWDRVCTVLNGPPTRLSTAVRRPP
jgi:hypothetical protein